MKPQELGATLKSIAESHAEKRTIGDSSNIPASELNFSQKGGMIGLDQDGTRRVAGLARQLLKDRPKIADMCSPETVRLEIVEVVKRFVCSATPLDPSTEAKHLIERLSGKPCDFLCVFPVKGGSIVATMKLNRTVLVPSLELIPAALVSEFPDLVKVPIIDLATMIRREIPPMPPRDLLNATVPEPDWYIISKSQALDQMKAEEKAINIAVEDLGLLRFRMLKSRRQAEDPLSIDLGKDPVFMFKKGKTLGAIMEEISCETFFLPSGFIEIPQVLDFLASGADADFTKTANILNADKRTGLQERVYLGYVWLNKALMQRDPREQLLDSIIGMEALMLKSHESRGDILPERVAFCLGHDFSSRKRIFDHLRELVQMRNRVSHEGKMNVLKEHADSSTRTLGSLIEAMTERCDKHSTIDEFIEYVEKLKFS